MSFRRNLALLLLAAPGLLAQEPAWKEFSIGPPTANRSQFSRFGIRAEGVPMRRLLARSFSLPEHRILGPGWIDSTRYAIVAQVSDPKDFQPLMQKELAARFQLLSHKETREVPVFVLKQGESGTKPAAPGVKGQADVHGGGLIMTGTPAEFAAQLADAIGRPVFDETGLGDSLQFSLSWEGGNMPSLRDAVKNQLGMQLIEERRSVELLIIDHIEKLQ